MEHGLNNDWLYGAIKLTAFFTDEYGNKPKEAMGTGFLIKRRDGVFCLITNKHVVDGEWLKAKDFTSYRYHKLSKLKMTLKTDDSDGKPTITSEWFMQDWKDLLFPKNAADDVACFPNPLLEDNGADDGADDGTFNVGKYFFNEGFLATDVFFEKEFQICDFLAFPGYPRWHDETEDRPILRVGTLASDPRFNYSSGSAVGNCLAYEAFSTGGSSGSPVLSMQKGLGGNMGITTRSYRPPCLVGINAGHIEGDGYQHSLISYFYKSTVILQLLRASEEEK